MRTVSKILRFIIMLIAVVQILGGIVNVLDPPQYATGGTRQGEIIQSQLWAGVANIVFWGSAGTIALVFEIKSNKKPKADHKNAEQQNSL